MPQNHEKPVKGLDIDHLKNNSPETIRRYAVYFSREARNAPLPHRVNPVVMNGEEFRKLVDPDSELSTSMATTKIYEWFKQDIPAIKLRTKSLRPSPEEILEALVPFVDQNPHSLMVWISAKGEVYQEVRLNIYQTIEVNGEKYLFFWGIPTLHTDQECLKFAKRLEQHSADQARTTDDVENLRVNPLSLWIPKETSLTAFLSGQIDLPEVWKAIANRKIILETIDDLKRGFCLITPERYLRIKMAQTEIEKARIGWELQEAIKATYRIELLSDAHGPLYANPDFFLLRQLGLGLQVGMERLISPMKGEIMSERVHCGGCGEYKEGEKMSLGFQCKKRGSSAS